MNILPASAINSDDWAQEVRQYQAPDWTGVSPEEVARRGRPWDQDPAQRPWFDGDGAHEKIARMADRDLITPDETRLLDQWTREGYFVLKNAIQPDDLHLLDSFASDLNGLWSTDRPATNAQLSGVRVDGTRLGPVDHAEILGWPRALREKCRDSQSWRVHYFQPYTKAGLELSRADRIMRLCGLLLDNDPVLMNLTAFKYSSEVGHHQDMMFYHVHPINHMVGVWLACEDIDPDAGPLCVYPGSQRIPIWPGFANYPQTNYRTCHRQSHIAFENYLVDSVTEDNRLRMPIKKGDAVFLNGMCVHGSDKAKRRGDLTRYSMVLHYTVPGGNREREIEGPFNF